MTEDCNDIKFYTTNETYGGTRKVDPCIPSEPRKEPELIRPKSKVPDETPILTPDDIIIESPQVTLHCKDKYSRYKKVDYPAYGNSSNVNKVYLQEIYRSVCCQIQINLFFSLLLQIN